VNLIKQIGDRHLFELLRGSFVALFFRVLGVVSIFLFMKIVTDLYGTEGYGLYNTLWAILMVGAVVAKLGFDSSIVKFIAAFYAQKKFRFITQIYRKGLSWISIAGILVGVLLFIFSKQLSIGFFETDEHARLIVIIAMLVTPLSIIHFNAETLKALKNITAFSAFQNGTLLIVSLLVIGLFAIYRTLQDDIIYALGIAIVVLVPFSFILIRKGFGKRLNTNFEHVGDFPFSNGKILKTTLPMFYANSLFLIMGWADTLMISGYMDNADVGIYNGALKIATISSTILMAVNSIAMPKYAELFERNDFQLFKNFVKQTSLLILLISLPLFLVIFIFPSFVLNLVDPQFVEGKEALLILAFGHFISAISGSTIHLLNMTGKELIARNILLVSAVINIGLNFIFIPIWGITGAAIATSATTILWNLLAVFFIYRKFGFLTLPLNVKVRK
jgi:O-antigen/teichoic acid export membrane protein